MAAGLHPFLLRGVALALLLAAIWFARHALLLAYVSAIFAAVLLPVVERIQGWTLFGRRLSRPAALLVLISLVTLALTLLAVFALPPLIEDAGRFFTEVPQKVSQLRDRLSSVRLIRDVDFSKAQSAIVAGLGGVASALGGLGALLLDAVTMLLLTAYLILDGETLLAAGLKLLPAPQAERLDRTLRRAAARMRGWLAGQVMLMGILAGASLATFGLMRIPYFILLAVFAGAANIVPLLGPWLTVIVAGAVAAADSGWKALGVGIFYLVYQQVENAFLTPAIMKSQVQLPSAIVIISLLFAGELGGIAGAVVAVPSAVLAAELLYEYGTG